jgi:putative SbcD/Mre11-related phosphoesterase
MPNLIHKGDCLKNINFAFDEPAAIVKDKSKRYLVIGDLHIGRELKLAGKGIRVYGTTELMADRALALMKKHRAKVLVILGDVKDSITRPDSTEMRIIHSFFNRFTGYGVVLVQGNHDAGLGELGEVLKVKEFSIGNVGLIHGNALPSEDLMQKELIIAAHDHPAIMSAPFEEGGNLEKAWVLLDVKYAEAEKFYDKPDRKIKLVLMPAFNDLIVGNDIEGGERVLNPLIRKGIFNRASAKIYDQKGVLVKTGF